MSCDALLSLLSRMDAMGASDLFLTAGKAPAARVHGVVTTLDAPKVDEAALSALADHVLPERLRAVFESTGDHDAGLTLDGDRRFRLNFNRQQGRVGVVARAVPSGALDLDDLGVPPAARAFADGRRGLVLVTGATGAGKSTTLAALVHRINAARAVHIVTIEDPIEFVHRDAAARVTQREVGIDTESFEAGLRHVVRQSPDVIVIGELRDPVTVQVAVSAALTGHLVLASMHTIDAAQTLQRLLSFFPEHLRAQAALDLSLCLRGVISQRLLPRAGGEGRVLAAEIMSVGPAAARLIREGRTEELQELMKSDVSPGMRGFNEALLALHSDGVIDFEVGLAHATNPDEFALSVRGMASGIAGLRDAPERDDAASTLDMNHLIEAVLRRGASDLHLTEGRPPILRISGELQALGDRRLTDADLRALLYSIMSSRQRSTYELERELDFALAVSRGRRFRVNAYFQKGRMAAALRAIPSDIPDAEALRLPPQLLDLGGRSQGLLLVVGPTGAGKSTTLACLVDRINHARSCRIVTVEDPIEYVHDGDRATVDQREVHADTHSFAAALKYVLRQDPDVILVGEMRDLETISAALTAAETGHLVLATLHANDALQAIDRIIDVFPSHQQGQARSQLAACLLGVVSQRLLPRRDGAGRVPAFEVMMGTSAIRNLIRENKLHQGRSIMEGARRDGMVTMDNALRALYQAGEVAYEDVVPHLTNPRSIVPPTAPSAQAPAPEVEDEPAVPRGRFPWSRG